MATVALAWAMCGAQIRMRRVAGMGAVRMSVGTAASGRSMKLCIVALRPRRVDLVSHEIVPGRQQSIIFRVGCGDAGDVIQGLLFDPFEEVSKGSTGVAQVHETNNIMNTAKEAVII